MILHRHIIGSSYFVKPGEAWGEWLRVAWSMNVTKYCPDANVVIISQGGQRPQFVGANTQWIYLDGDLGHLGQLMSKEKTYRHSGFTATMLALALIAYTDVSDIIFLEQDCFAFGPWREKLYEEVGDKGLLFGNCRLMGAAQSIFLLRHWFIPEFVRRYLEHSDTEVLGEHKFSKMEQESPDKVGRFSFPYDRDRPIDPTLPVFYFQKGTPDDFRSLEQHGLFSTVGMPDAKVFSNCA